MTRAAYDTTCDIYEGPAGTNPNALRHSNLDCRVVAETEITIAGKPFNARVVHITLDPVTVVAAWTATGGGVYTFDATQTDRVAVPTGGSILYGVITVETVANPPQATYIRLQCVLLPYP